jgi:prevent-host-death family protein
VATVTAFEAKTRFGELLERVGRGEEVVITRHDTPVARIIPEGRQSIERVRQAVSALNQVRAQIGRRLQGRAKLTNEQVRSAIASGRR